MNARYAYVQVPTGARRGCWVPQSWTIGSGVLFNVPSGNSSYPLEEQHVLATEPPFHSLLGFLIRRIPSISIYILCLPRVGHGS